jgi:hypothetical protein
MPIAHTIDYYTEAVLAEHDVTSVHFEPGGFGKVAVTVLPLDLQQPVIDWLNSWGGRAAYLHFYSQEAPPMILNLRSVNKQLAPSGFEVVDKIADTLVLKHQSGDHFNVTERELIAAGVPVLEFIQQAWEKRGKRESK